MMVTIDTTEDILNALRNKYNSAEYAFLTNVGNCTGFTCNRHADVIAMNLWPSRGLQIIGFEIKASRSDWFHELKKPSKADPIATYCDSWFLVIGDAEILKPGELPLGWGLMVPQTKNTLKIVKESKVNLKPKPIDRNFVAALLRRASEQVFPEAKLNNEYLRGLKEGREGQDERTKTELKYKIEQIQKYEKIIKDFQAASGIELDSWRWSDATKIGEAVKVVLNGSYLKELEGLKNLRNHAERCVKSIDEEIRKLDLKHEEKTVSGQ